MVLDIIGLYRHTLTFIVMFPVFYLHNFSYASVVIVQEKYQNCYVLVDTDVIN